MLEIRDLHVKFHTRQREAVAGVSLTIHDGEILGLVGESGSGKSVTAMSVAGLLPRKQCDFSGEILLDGAELLHADRTLLRQVQGREIGVVFQEPQSCMDPLMRIGPQVEEVLRLLDQTDAARNLIGLRGSPSFSGVKPVAEALDRADRGGALNTRELLTIADLLTAAHRAKEYFNDEAAEKTAIDHLFLSLHGNRFLEEKIKRAIPDEDTIADAASTELATCGRPRPRAARSFKRSSPPPAMGKFCRRPSSPSGTAASWCR